MRYEKTHLLILVLAIAFALVGWWSWQSRRVLPLPPAGPPTLLPVGQMRVGSTLLTVEVADTPAAQTRGLSGRAGLAEDAGMLFTYATSTTPRFWMPDMRFGLDLIWINASTVVGVTPNVLPESYPNTFSPPQPVTAALEVPAGWASRHGVSAGTRVEWPVE